MTPTTSAEDSAETTVVGAWQTYLYSLRDARHICDETVQKLLNRITRNVVSDVPGTEAGNVEAFCIGTDLGLPPAVIFRVTGLPREQEEESSYVISRRCGMPAM